MLGKAIFLDRDGVINKLCYNPDHGTIDSPLNERELTLFKNVPIAIKKINNLGYKAVIVSNQPGIAKGKMNRENLNKITQKLLNLIEVEGARIDGIYYCLHHPEATIRKYQQECTCRKPNPGLLIKASDELDIDLDQSYMIGDGLTDIICGKEVGCKTFWIGKWKCELCQSLESGEKMPDYIATSLFEAVNLIEKIERKS